ncbi:MAG: hypothetical protein ABJ387_00530 [Balneola sp.]
MSEKEPKKIPPRPRKDPHMIKEGENKGSRKIIKEQSSTKDKKRE